MTTAAPRSLFAPARAETGFTLIETLVALALLALIMAGLASGVSTARHALGYLERSQSTIALASARNYLRSVFLHGRTLPLGRSTQHAQLSFDGTAGSVRFVSTHVPRGQYEGIYVVEIAAEPSRRRGSMNLVVRQALYRPDADEDKGSVAALPKATLIEDIEEIAFSYFGAMDDDAAPQWSDTWRHSVKLPRLVALEITFPRRDLRQWQRVHLPIQASSSPSSSCPPRVFCR